MNLSLIENIVGKGGNTAYTQCFQKLSSLWVAKTWDCVVKL